MDLISVSSGMEWNTSYFNLTVNTTFDSDLDEFPYWRATVATYILAVLLIALPIDVFFYGSFLLTFFTTKTLRKQPLNYVHMSILIEQFLIKVAVQILEIAFSTQAHRYCICPSIINDFYLPLVSFNLVYNNVIFTIVSVLQLVGIKGSKRLASTKIVVVLIGSSVFYSTLWMVASL